MIFAANIFKKAKLDIKNINENEISNVEVDDKLDTSESTEEIENDSNNKGFYNLLSEEKTGVEVMPKMNRLITSIKDSWIEYSKNSISKTGTIVLSIKAAEIKFGTRWRANSGEQKFYLRRLPLFRLIEKLIIETPIQTEEMICESLQLECNSKYNSSLSKFSKVVTTNFFLEKTIFNLLIKSKIVHHFTKIVQCHDK